jgi:MFS family permease
MPLAPVEQISADALRGAQRTLVLDSAFASVTGAFSGGVILAAFALALGANAQQIGLLAAIPIFAQLAQLPATVLIERVRQRRKIGVLAITVARLLIALVAMIPFIPDRMEALDWLIAAQIAISILNSVGGCAVNSWLHHLVPPDRLGVFFSRRLFWGTTSACAATLAAGFMIDHLPLADRVHTYAISFVLGGIAGLIGSYFLGRTPEPMMPPMRQRVGLGAQLWAPFEDANFRRLLIFLGSWAVASNLAAPFITVFLIKQLGYPLTIVTALWVVSQIANALTLYAWGRVSDRLSNKGILAAALPIHFVCMFVLVFSDSLRDPTLRLSLLVAIHIFMGIVGGGIGLAVGNLGLKLAPQGRGTAYLAAIGIVSAMCGGITPIVAGNLAHLFEVSELSAVVRWTYSGQTGEFVFLRFAQWEFVFALSALFGLYVMHALSRVREGAEVEQREVIQEFAFEAFQSVNVLSSLGGTVGAIFPFFDRLFDRIGFWNKAGPRTEASGQAEQAKQR